MRCFGSARSANSLDDVSIPYFPWHPKKQCVGAWNCATISGGAVTWRRNLSIDDALVELIQLHERLWGTESYPGRPSLALLLKSPIIVMWQPNERRATEAKRGTTTGARFTLSAHHSWEELD